MAAFTSKDSHNLWVEDLFNNILILCQDDVYPRLGSKGIYSNRYYVINSTRPLCLFQFSLILLVVSATSFLLKPFGLPILSQMAGGVIVMGLLFPNNGEADYMFLPNPVLYILRNLSYFGFILHIFMLGVEINMGALMRIGKKSITISFVSFACSLLISFFTYNVLQTLVPGYLKTGSWRLILLQAQNFFGVTCTNVNNLGISNSELGRLASAAALVIDILTMLSAFIIFNLIVAMKEGDFLQPILILGLYVFLFVFLRPILLHIISYTPQGSHMSHTHFIAILFVVLIATMASSLVDQYFSVYFLALSIPQEPLSSILAEKLDAITSGFFYPLFCALHGFEANFGYLEDFRSSAAIELVLISGHFGKFLGTYFSSRMFAIPWKRAISLGIILTSKGFLDIIITRQWSERGDISIHEYTLTSLHILITTFALLPLVRKLYEPSKHYSTVFRQNVSESSQIGTLKALSCIYNEENVPGILHFIEALHPSKSNPIPVVTVQLIQLTGRCSLPIMSTWHHVKSYAALRSHISRGNRIINAYSNLERKFKGFIHMQHYVSVSPYATMHNDICNLAYEKNVSLLILPFHVQWTVEGRVDHSTQSIRDVNKMVFEKAPCSVAILINRGGRDLIQLQLHLPNHDMYRVSIFFLGGPDDQEALAFSKFFVNHPFITLTLIWLNSGQSNEKNSNDFLVIEKAIRENEGRVDYKEVICNDGSETTKVLKKLKDGIDLAVVGKHHDPQCAPLLGLDGEWNEYPELGVLGDFLLTSDFSFSILVVQKDPQQGLHILDV